MSGNGMGELFLSIFYVETTNSIGCRIIQCHPSLRIGDPGFSFQTSNGFMIRSWQQPELNKHAFYLPGVLTENDDNFFVGVTFGESVSNLLSRMICGIHEFLENHFQTSVDIHYKKHEGGDRIDFMEFDGQSQLHTKE